MNRILKKITRELAKIEDVKAIVLYGSFARKENISRSDIDLFILTTDKSTIKQVQEKIIELENTTGRTIQPTVRTIKELQKTDTGLLLNIFQEGKVLYLKEATEIPSAILLEQKPFLIYSFQLNKLNQKQKAQFNSNFYGRTKDKYQYTGFLNEINGQKLSSGCVIIPHTKKSKIEKFFRKFKIDFKQVKVWK
jgi:predicted nucleotidyltransferase